MLEFAIRGILVLSGVATLLLVNVVPSLSGGAAEVALIVAGSICAGSTMATGLRS